MLIARSESLTFVIVTVMVVLNKKNNQCMHKNVLSELRKNVCVVCEREEDLTVDPFERHREILLMQMAVFSVCFVW